MRNVFTRRRKIRRKVWSISILSLENYIKFKQITLFNLLVAVYHTKLRLSTTIGLRRYDSR